MGLQEQQISFKFIGGIETMADPKTVPGVRLLALENGVFTKAGSIKKRNGYGALSRTVDGSVSLIDGARRLGQRDNELLLFTDNRCYSKQSGNDQWTDMGAAICAVGTDRAAVQTGTQQTMPDHATNGGVTAYAWEDSLGGVWWTVVDAESGAIYRAPEQADALGERPRCVAVGDVIHVYYAVPTQRTVMLLIVNPATPSADLTPSIIIEDLDTTNPVYDACPTERAGTPAAIAWHEHATTNIRVGYADAGGMLGSPASGYPSVARFTVTLLATSPIGLAFQNVDGDTGDNFLIAYMSGTEGQMLRASAGSDSEIIGFTTDAHVPYAVATLVKRIAIAEADGTAWVVFEENHATASKRFCVVNSCDLAGGVGTERTLRSVGLASRAFQAGADEDAFAVFVHDTTYFNIYLTFRLSDFADCGRHLAGSASGAPAQTHLSSVHSNGDLRTVTLPYKTRVASTNNDTFTETALRQISMDFGSDDAYQVVQLGRGAYMAGAVPQHYDGRQWCEQGFHVGPELISGVASNGAGSLTVDSDYSYLVWYEWTDAQGEIHRGPTSVPFLKSVAGAEDTIVLTLPTLRVTRKSNVRINVARCLPGDATRFWRVSSLDPTTDGDPNGYITNSTSVDSVSFEDRMSDADLQEQELIYTTGGILSNDPTALGSIVVAGKNRLFFTDASAGSVVRFSQRIATGFGVEIAPELALDVDPYGGDITALSIMDDVVYAFKASCIFAFNGDGPLETGSSATQGFSSSQIITSDVGCTDPSSIVLTPLGLMFKSPKGIYLLDRSRNVTYIGAPAEAYNAQTVRRANVMPDRRQVVFLTDSGSTLLYDYLFGQWSTFTNHEGYDSAVVDNTYYYLRTTDTVYQETIDEHSDAGARITLKLETAWLHLHEHLQGFQRFWKLLLLGTWQSPHQLGIQERLSYDESWNDASWLDATGDTDGSGWLSGEGVAEVGVDPISGSVYGDGGYGVGPYGGSGPDVYQWRYGIWETGQSIQFRFQDYEKAGLAGASFELTEMTIVGGIEKVDSRPFSGSRST